MPDERFKDALIDIRQRATSSLNEDSKVGCCTYVTDNARMCVALVVKCVRKPINMWSAESRAQPSKCLIRAKMSFEQECSPVVISLIGGTTVAGAHRYYGEYAVRTTRQNAMFKGRYS